MNRPILPALLVALAVSSPSSGLELADNAQMHGFLNQAYLYSPDNPYAGTDATNGSFKFREVGVNGFVELSPEFRLAGQVLSRRQDKADDGDVRVDFLLADYLYFSNQKISAGVRAGRVKNNIGFYNAIRDIPSARPGYNVPDSVYFDAFRDTLLATDGINLYGSILAGDNQVSWEFTVGERSVDSEDFEYYSIGRPVQQGEVDDVPIRLFNVNLVPSFQRDLRLGLSLVDLSIKLDDTPSLADVQAALMNNPQDVFANPQNYVTRAEIDALFAILSAQYSLDDWVITAEYLNIDSDFDGQIAGQDFSDNATTEGYYLQLEWLATNRISILTRYEELYLDKDDRSGSRSAVDYNRYRGFGKGWTLGGRWAVTENWSLTGQASFNEGTAWLPTFEGIENEDIEKYWNYYVLSVNFQF